MIQVEITQSGAFQVLYRLEGVRVHEFITTDLEVALKEVKQKMILERGLAKGKVLTTYTGKEI
jgi:hypothetical protein